MRVHQEFDLRQDRSSKQDWVGFFSLVAMETIVLPSSFLPCIPPHNAMKSKLPFDKSRLEWCMEKKRVTTQAAERRTRAEKTSPRKFKWSWDRWSVFTHWSFCFLRATCYLISGRLIFISDSQQHRARQRTI